jgi:tellurite methyltransferase
VKTIPSVKIPILDLRPAQLFYQSHIIGSASFPVSELFERLHELPIRAQAVELFGSVSELEIATQFLSSKGYRISQTQVADQQKLLELQQSNNLAFGKSYQRLWQPARIVKRFIENYSLHSENKTGLDLACGSGRDTVYMSMQGYSMTAVDYLPSALQKLSDLAIRCEQSIKSILLDMEKLDDDKHCSPLTTLQHQYGCVVVVRYLHRPGLAQLKRLIDIGGYIVYQTFMHGCEKFGSPKNPRYLLELGELAEVFSDFDILVDEVEYLPDGRPTNCFIAKRIE